MKHAYLSGPGNLGLLVPPGAPVAPPTDSGFTGTEGKLDRQEALAEDLNNTLQNMWRATRSAGLSTDNAVLARIDAAIAEWEPWWLAFKDNSFERAQDALFDMGFDLFTIGADWDTQLVLWEGRVAHLDNELRELLRQQVQTGEVDLDQARAFEGGMVERGEDEKLERYRRDAAGGTDPRAKGFLMGLAAVAGLGALWFYARSQRKGR